ncbi:hypothetical protein BMS_1849 [Halobacteriovorax marinus SJ]|uniref:L,D-TPase catalytic domain-containing protein n=1 Tax=Halobacteriovorax marinus (strain ATCC BAA-682 / DSM 15412 / SJ) TaxID=862908 RepID=E1X209_HALMS|nr:L,D-transpeptidase [Halobacteriovorax marinus]CBW26669.1 hypothetical protein BMS_1849 [Halobacteriovorax marinus SJ]
MKLTAKLAGTAFVLATFLSAPSHTQLIPSANASFFGRTSNWKEINLPAQAENKVVGVRVEDVVKHLPSFVPGLAHVSKELLKDQDQYFGDKGKVDEVLNLFFNELPKWNGNRVQLKLTALIKYNEDTIAFKKISVEYNSTDVKEFIVTPEKFTALSSTKLVFDVGLKSRKVVVKDKNSDMTMVFPLGVGSFDEAVLNDEISLLTPRFKNGYLDKSKAIRNRKMPRYFANLPFIRILKGSDAAEDYTGIGFHAQPFPDKNEFIRAFDSHGCMRMQTPDLWSMYYLVAAGPTKQLPITVKYTANNSEEHPFPKRNKPYKRVANTGSRANPNFTLDRDNLVLVHNNWKESAPVEELYDRSGDNYHQIFNYSTAELVEDKWEGIRAKCKARSYDNPSYAVKWEDYAPEYDLDDSQRQREKKLKKAKKKYQKAVKKMNKKKEKAYEDCIDDHKRDVSLGDRLYRWWVHG